MAKVLGFKIFFIFYLMRIYAEKESDKYFCQTPFNNEKDKNICPSQDKYFCLKCRII